MTGPTPRAKPDAGPAPTDDERRAVADHVASLLDLHGPGDPVLAGRTLDDGRATIGVASSTPIRSRRPAPSSPPRSSSEA